MTYTSVRFSDFKRDPWSFIKQATDDHRISVLDDEDSRELCHIGGPTPPPSNDGQRCGACGVETIEWCQLPNEPLRCVSCLGKELSKARSLIAEAPYRYYPPEAREILLEKAAWRGKLELFKSRPWPPLRSGRAKPGRPSPTPMACSSPSSIAKVILNARHLHPRGSTVGR